MNPAFIERLQWARNHAEIPFHINSGWRCSKHNAAVGGSVNSSHLRGLAADIQARDSKIRMRIVKALLEAGFSRIGVSCFFIHVDISPTKEKNVLWFC